MRRRRGTAAARLYELLRLVTGADVPVRLRAWDGTEAGPLGAPVLVVRSRRALRRLMWDTGELGLGRAYVAGEIDSGGDLLEALGSAAELGEHIGRRPRLSLRDRGRLLGGALLLGAVGPAPKPPSEEIQLHGEKHSKARDKVAVSSHYDVGNEFYRLVLGESMVYSCAYWTRADDPSYTLDDAQRDKLDLVCRKLGLHEGMRVLDVGCGWGSFALHAAREYGVEVVGITLSEQQAEFAQKRVAEATLEDRVDIRVQDWRDLTDPPFDAISSIGMAEHVGEDRFAEYARALHDLLRPGGRLLNHQIAGRPGPTPKRRTFVDAYVFPDGALLPLATVVSRLEGAGLEVRDVQNLREHYALTLRGWVANIERNWEACVKETSEGRARVWRLYMALSAVGFDRGMIRVNQTLAVRPGPRGRTDFALVRTT